MEKLEFSIVLPAYNTPPEILRRAINSVLNQTYPYFELIIIDDGSIPSLCSVIKEYNDERIVFIRHTNNEGAGAAHNTGIKESKYDWVAFICHDDEWKLNKLEIVIDLIKKNENYCFFFHQVEVKNDIDNESPFNFSLPITGNYYNNLINNYNTDIQTSSVIISRKCFDKCGLYDKKFKNIFDWELYVRISEKFDFFFIPQILSVYYYTKVGITHSKNPESIRNITEMTFFLKKYKKKMSKETKQLWSFKLNSFIHFYKKEKKYLLMLRFLFASISFFPISFLNIKDIVKSLLKKSQ